jgi:cytochrome c oxidase assembly protein subunit 15
MTRTTDNPWLARFAVLTALSTLVLVCLGGLVTSHEAGMAVPDWPNTFGYNLFFFPISRWVGGIFYEHTHRLVASAVGLLTTILAAWLFFKESRRWLRWLGVVAFLAVVVQGVLGGLRVVLLQDELGIVHATLGQLFFVLTGSIALFTSRWWAEARTLSKTAGAQSGPRRWVLLSTLLIVVQLMLGATMRHQHAGLAIPDFPTAYGHLWPATDVDSIAHYNQNRVEATAVKPITAFQIVLQMLHRFVALAIFCLVVSAAVLTRQQLGWHNPLSKMAFTWLGLVVFQMLLGAATIWTGKSADIATAHVACGALLLMVGTLLSIISFCNLSPVAQQASAVAKEVTPSASFVGGPSVASDVP